MKQISLRNSLGVIAVSLLCGCQTTSLPRQATDGFVLAMLQFTCRDECHIDKGKSGCYLNETCYFEAGKPLSRCHASIVFGEYGRAFLQLSPSSGDCLLVRCDRLSRHDREGDTIDSSLLAINTEGGSFLDWMKGKNDVSAEALYLRDNEEPPTLRSQSLLTRIKSYDYYGDIIVNGRFVTNGFVWHEGCFDLTLRWVNGDSRSRLTVDWKQ
jgi:hypothetical protein